MYAVFTVNAISALLPEYNLQCFAIYMYAL